MSNHQHDVWLESCIDSFEVYLQIVKGYSDKAIEYMRYNKSKVYRKYLNAYIKVNGLGREL